MKDAASTRWRAVWAVVKASAEQRLGRTLLLVYLALAMFGLAVVAISIALMHM